MSLEVRDVVGFPGYCIGNDGSLWSQWKKNSMRSLIYRRRHGSNHDGYRSTKILDVNHLLRFVWIHRLVLEAFVGPCPEGLECCHNNGIRDDNRLSNLRWDTRSENTKDGVRHGTVKIPVANIRGVQVWKAKLTDYSVRRIRHLHSKGHSIREIGRLISISHGQVSRIIRRLAWAHVA